MEMHATKAPDRIQPLDTEKYQKLTKKMLEEREARRYKLVNKIAGMS